VRAPMWRLSQMESSWCVAIRAKLLERSNFDLASPRCRCCTRKFALVSLGHFCEQPFPHSRSRSYDDDAGACRIWA
jgi:hypothetical protein